MPITEESLREGEEWKETFSRGARRRRSASLGAGPSVDAAAVFHGGIVINVDQVDKRRKSQDFSDDGRRRSGEAHLVHHAPAPVADIPQPELPPASPIEEEEEDEDQLFPLPSPRRTPTPSPTATPNGSTPCLAHSASRDSLSQLLGDGPGSDDSGGSTGRGRCSRGLLTPDASPSLSQYSPSACRGVSSNPRRSPSPTCNSVSTSQLPTPMPSPSLPPSLSRRPSHTHMHRHEGSASSTATYDPPASPTPTPHALKMHRRRSFSIPFMKAADILKGVTAISGSTAGSAFTPGV
ncbi:hypothetical protein PLICRDRAFT_176902 [Plicaturopsis crispa FD-325 SS-3]|nr:hypothetical protein PLICRDRAFT_176902 [Plicaturopsis crispa FD-325 SS-3]